MIDPKHELVIEYCVPSDDLDEAVRVAAEIASGWAPVLRGIELRSGVKGGFTVSVDGEIVFAKAEAGHLPGSGEAARSIEARLGNRIRWRKSGASELG